MIAAYFLLALLPATEPLETLQLAEERYEAGDYRSAAAFYDQLAGAGARSAKFYQNQANLNFLAGNLPQALLAYRRATRNGGTSDELANLRDALAQAGNEAGRTAWGVGFRRPLWMYPLGAKTAAALVVWVISTWLFLLLSRPYYLRALGGGLLVGWLLAFLLYVDQIDIARHPYVVVAAEDVPIRQGNGHTYPVRVATGKEVRLHGGTEGRLRGERSNGWVQIELPDGQRGWVERRQVLIDE
jgi:hypothetical protein